jgi:site-specific DNA-methyltransferase (adenine-specific)
LRQSGQNKKDIIEIIGEELGRGRWSIEKAIKKMEKKD